MDKQNYLKWVDWRDNIKPGTAGHGAAEEVSETKTEKLTRGFTVLVGEGTAVLRAASRPLGVTAGRLLLELNAKDVYRSTLH